MVYRLSQASELSFAIRMIRIRVPRARRVSVDLADHAR